MSRKDKQDEHLPTGAIVYWSRKFRRGGYLCVPVWCPDCKRLREISAGKAAEDSYTGLCPKCRDLRRSAAARSRYPTTDEQSTGTGSVIHWSEMSTDVYDNLSVPVTCGDCRRKRTVRAKDTCEANYTGLCNKGCGQRYANRGADPGTKRERMGYTWMRLARDHPFYSMADEQGWVAEHRLVMAESLGRPLRSNETVHHRNGRKDDNRLENLELWCGSHPGGQRVADLESTAGFNIWRRLHELVSKGR